MQITIENDFLQVSVDTFGAELKSLKSRKSGREYLWQGDPQVWKDTAPFLFPVVARQLDDCYTLNGNTYHMPMHGFAKDKEFTPEAKAADSVTLTLTQDAETLTWYPFRFQLTTLIQLQERTLSVTHQVRNLSPEDMPYSLGEHPGFRVPMVEGESLSDYFLEFEQEESALRWYLDDEIIAGSEPGLSGKLLAVTPTLFDRGALIFKHLNSRYVTLRSKNHTHTVTMDLSGWEYLGIWAKPKAPYVCIEPWNGLASSKWSDSDIWKKEGIRRLAPGETERFAMHIHIT